MSLKLTCTALYPKCLSGTYRRSKWIPSNSKSVEINTSSSEKFKTSASSPIPLEVDSWVNFTALVICAIRPNSPNSDKDDFSLFSNISLSLFSKSLYLQPVLCGNLKHSFDRLSSTLNQLFG